MSCRRRAFAKIEASPHTAMSVAIGMTLREGAISFSALPMVRIIRVIKRPMRVRLSLSPDILDGYRLARRASVTTNGSRKLERALLSSSDWRHNMRGYRRVGEAHAGGLRR